MDPATSQRSVTGRTRICFVGLYAYSLFDENTRHRFGGAEVDGWQYATGLSNLPRYDVCFVVFDHAQPLVQQFDRVTVFAHPGYKAPRPAPTAVEEKIIWSAPLAMLGDAWFRSKSLIARSLKTLPVVVKHRLRLDDPDYLWIRDYLIEPEKWAVYAAIDADLYCVFGADRLTAEVAAYCRRAGKRLVLFVVSELNLSYQYAPDSEGVDLYRNPAHLCHYAIMQADLILCQTLTQASLLRARFGKESVVIRNPMDLTREVRSPTPHSDRRIALWVGKSDNVKRPQVLLQLAAVFPDVEFALVMNRADQKLFDQIVRDKGPNVTIYEHVPFSEIEHLFAESFALINTSISEGFPNAFLQAGKYGVPILSLSVDPDGFIERYKCGVVAGGGFDGLVEGMRRIQADRKGPQCFSKNIKRYVNASHSLEDRVRELDSAIKALGL